ncbi:hypothetical protein TNCV_3322971 [Trichonephila clavipes]|nr:hypothetical protein TNCV_3322971 [Trichonephila clavipes]
MPRSDNYTPRLPRPRQSVGVLLLKAEVTAWESMRKTTFTGTMPAASNCAIASQTAAAHRSRSTSKQNALGLKKLM